MIALQQKPDLDHTLARFEAWWNRQIVDRPPVNIHVKRRKPADPPAKTHASLRDRWLDVEYHVDCFEAGLAGQVFPADAVPIFYPSVGPEVCGTLLGCELEFGENTSWSKPVVSSCRQVIGRPL